MSRDDMAFERQQRLDDIFASAETDSEIDYSRRPKKYHISENEHDRNSKQGDIDSNAKFFIRKDGTKWKKYLPAKSVSAKYQNIVTHLL